MYWLVFTCGHFHPFVSILVNLCPFFYSCVEDHNVFISTGKHYILSRSKGIYVKKSQSVHKVK